ncbi:MAG: gamma carbonic anhydrase family protein [Acidimicrobiia bacterium]|nr:gamma carbonic anhydrase family protein [bacterium]MXX00636.1 gamma carbonic anhydrase family protein [Acidimicrobiia bacterium]MXY73963.1 gamma carbonic anhydrase family protein [Acidimicrobiia bacterium]MYB78734.1 gamma carbonic anhydrase family protein [Acidimicrobiia bacterium]MYG91516.1 gamma carbonic anhydrase family protein [Acidimicrobiia bacterium]
MDRVPRRLAAPVIHPSAFIASNARVFGDVVIEAEAVVMFGVVIRAETDRVVVGEETNIQDNSVLHADRGYPTILGRRISIGHSAVIHGAVIGDRCLVGMGAIALNGAVMGEGSWLAAGSLLPEGKEIPPWTIAVGTPARPLRELRPHEIERAEMGVEEYLSLGITYRRLEG